MMETLAYLHLAESYETARSQPPQRRKAKKLVKSTPTTSQPQPTPAEPIVMPWMP